MEVQVKLRHLRMSPRKVRKVADLIRNANVEDAKLHLKSVPQRAAKPLLKLIDSAINDAKHNFGLDETRLYIKKLTIDGGPTLKRMRARAFGLAFPIAKRTSHITLVLEEGKAPTLRVPVKVALPSAIAEMPVTPSREEAKNEERKVVKIKSRKAKQKPKIPLKQRLTQTTRRFFQRKAIG